MIKTDPLTGEKFKALRSNQKFATPENRIKYYNDKAKQLRHESAYIDKPLRNNHLILNEILAGKDHGIFHKKFLEGKGYSINVYTHVEDYKGTRRFAIYEYIIVPAENEHIEIIRIK